MSRMDVHLPCSFGDTVYYISGIDKIEEATIRRKLPLEGFAFIKIAHYMMCMIKKKMTTLYLDPMKCILREKKLKKLFEGGK